MSSAIFLVETTLYQNHLQTFGGVFFLIFEVFSETISSNFSIKNDIFFNGIC
jgi:hypothetical protein